MAEIAICATDLAEVIGTAIGLNLLFGIPLELGVFITALDVFLILYLQNLGFRWIEAFVVTTLLVIAACFAIQVGMARPDIREVILGFAPTVEIVRNPEMLYLAMGILGATVMPHNLYLHSSIVQTRMVADTIPAKREAIKFATIDSTIALMLALLVNASILILAAATFHKAGEYNVADLGDAQKLLTPLLGSAAAATAFGIALLCCGLNSTVTATLSGQIVMEGFINVRLPAWARRLATRALAIIPAVIAIALYGASGTGRLIILSQVILSHAASLRDRAARHVHRGQAQNGRARRAALGHGARGAGRGRRDRAQRQDHLRSLGRLAIPPAYSAGSGRAADGACTASASC